MRPLPTSEERGSAVGGMPLGAAGALSGAARANSVVRRAYFELVALRQAEGPAPLTVLADPRLASALALVRAAAGSDPFRIAALLPLRDEPRDMLGAVLRAADALARHGIGLDVWPQLDDESRFLCGATARTFQERLLPLVDRIERSAHRTIGLALDLEPAAAWSHAAWRVARGSVVTRAQGVAQLAWRSTRHMFEARQGRRDLLELARDLEARTLPMHVAVLPPFTPDGELVRSFLLGVPSADVEGASLFSNQAAMCYATSLARVSPRFDRARQQRALALWAVRHKERSDSVVVGQTATGIFGDEPTYASAHHLAEDVRAMESLGFTDIAVYALEGALFGPSGCPDGAFTLRADVDAWLAALMGR